MGVAAEAVSAGAASELAAEIEFVGSDGVRREPLASAWNVAFERVAAVRGFGSYRGQRNWPGWWWFSRTGEHVGYESWAERDCLMALDADPEVVGVASQPMWLHWVSGSGQTKRHAPDFFVRRADGTGLLVDVRPDSRVSAEDAAVFADTAVLAGQVGWDYRRVGCLDAVSAANLRWLAGYRHPRCARPVVMAALATAFVEPVPLGQGAAMAGDPVATLPVLFSMLWRGPLATDLTGQRLAMTSLVWATAAGRTAA